MENSLSFKLDKCFNFLMSNKLRPDKIETHSQEQLSKFLKVFKRNYILDNVQLVDIFSDLFTRCRYLIAIVIPEGSYFLG